MRAVIEHSIDAPSAHPNGLDWDNGRLWVIGGHDRKVYLLDPYTGEVLRSIQTCCHNGVIHAGDWLYVVDRDPATIYRLDPETGQELGTLTPTGPVPIGLAWDGRYIYCGEHHAGVCKLDPTTNTVVAQYPGQGSRTHGVAWDGEALWFVDADLATFYRIDTSDGHMLASFPSPDGITPHGLTWDGETLWFSSDQPHRIHRLKLLPWRWGTPELSMPDA